MLEPGPSRSPSISSSSATSCPSLETAIAHSYPSLGTAMTQSSPPESPPCHPPDSSPSPNSPTVSCLLDDDTASIEEMGDAAIDEDVIGSLVEEGEEGNLLGELFENRDVAKNITSDLTSYVSDVQRDFSEEERMQHLPEEQLNQSDTCKNPAVGEVFLVPSVNRFYKPGSSCDSQTEAENEVQVLDRFQYHRSYDAHPCRSLVVEGSTTDWSVSPFSGARLEPLTLKLDPHLCNIARLSPFIRRDTETEPPGLAALRKLEKFATRLHPIDFCYLQPQLLPAVNCLAEKVNHLQFEKT